MTLARCISCFCGVPWPERVQTEKRSLLKISIRFTTHLYIERRLFKIDKFSKWRLQCRHSSGLPETRTRVFINLAKSLHFKALALLKVKIEGAFTLQKNTARIKKRNSSGKVFGTVGAQPLVPRTGIFGTGKIMVRIVYPKEITRDVLFFNPSRAIFFCSVKEPREVRRFTQSHTNLSHFNPFTGPRAKTKNTSKS